MSFEPSQPPQAPGTPGTMPGLAPATPQLRFASSVWRTAQQTGGAAPAAAGTASFAAAHWQAQRVVARQDAALQTLTGQTMGTSWSLRLANRDYLPLAQAQALVQSTLDEVIAQMSNWEPDSAISRFNRAAAGSWHSLPPQLAQVLEAALHWAQACDGAWDPSLGALVRLWGFGPRPEPLAPHAGQPPTLEQIQQAQRICGYQRLQWRAAQRELWQPGGLELDLSGIAKGFAVDWVSERLQSAGWQHGLLEIGGELRGWGCRPDGAPWRVAVAGQEGQQALVPLGPLGPRDAAALATSGDRWHAFEHAGRRYSHTLDPRSGSPVAHGLCSVTVWHAHCMHADALATVLTVLGPQRGWEFALAHEVAAVFQSHADTDADAATDKDAGVMDSPVRITPAWLARLQNFSDR